MYTLIAYSESLDPAAAEVNVAVALGDNHITNQGDDVTVPRLNQIVLMAAGLESVAPLSARFSSPSLRRMGSEFVSPFNETSAAAVEPGSPQAVVDRRYNPRALVVGEELQFLINTNPAAAQIQWGIVCLSDGPIMERKNVADFTMRGTASITGVASTWASGNITLDERLNAGRYQVVGLRVESASLVAARLIDNESGRRPGVVGCDETADIQFDGFRHGGMGVMMEFEHNQLPRLEILCNAADSAQVVYLDLVKIRD